MMRRCFEVFDALGNATPSPGRRYLRTSTLAAFQAASAVFLRAPTVAFASLRDDKQIVRRNEAKLTTTHVGDDNVGEGQTLVSHDLRRALNQAK